MIHGLIDLSTIFRKNYYSDETSAVSRTVNDVHKYAAECGGSVTVCLDSPPYNRCSIMPSYKSHREEQPAALYQAQDDVCRRLSVDGFKLASSPGCEADDVIATLALKLSSQHKVKVYSSDKDLLQVVDDNVTVVSTATGRQYDRNAVIEKFGIEPKQIPDYLALAGDSSDGIPGLPGCGPKTAAKWLQQYGDLEGVFHAVGEIEPQRFRKALLDLSKELHTYRVVTTLLPVEGITMTDEPVTQGTDTNPEDEPMDIAPTRADNSLGLGARLCRVMLGVKRLRKNGENRHHGYKYATDADVLELVRGLLAYNEIEFQVSMLEARRRPTEGKSVVTEAMFEMVFRHKDEIRRSTWWAEASDTQDKGINKAATAAVKYFLLKTFLISTGDPEDDSDHGGGFAGGRR